MDRREFMRVNAAGALCLAAGALLPTRLLAETGPDIAVVKGGPAASARAAVELLGGMKRFVKKGQKVVIKPNMSFARGPESGTTTNPHLVAALSAMCWEAGASDVLVLDNTLSSVEACLDNSGVREACEAVRPDMVHGLSSSRFFREAEIPGAVDMKENEFMSDVLGADVLIAAPVAKSHGSTGVSLSMKGMMGLIANRSVMHWRYDLDTAIVDLNSKLRADLVVIDATRVLSSGGPGGPGKVLKEDTVIASADPVAADALAVKSFPWYGQYLEPRQVKHIKLAAERGLGRMDLDRLRIERVNL